MSDDEADPELLALLRKSLGISPQTPGISSDTKVLSDADFIYSNSIDVAIDMRSTQAAADMVWEQMQQRSYSTQTWSEHELHPKAKDEATVNFIFTMDLLNFSFWSERSEQDRFAVTFRGKRWTGYWSLVACLQRALEEGVPITTPSFWLLSSIDQVNGESHDFENPGDRNESTMATATASDCASVDVLEEAVPTNGDKMQVDSNEDLEHENTHAVPSVGDLTDADGAPVSEPDLSHATTGPSAPTVLTEEVLRHIFRSDSNEEMPLLAERLACLREAGAVLTELYEGSVVKLVESAHGSAGMLVNLLATHFDCFRDETRFERRKVQFLKRAQILVADLWAAFNGASYGRFDDIDKITMFADYRVPQMLHSLGVLAYSPPLLNAITNRMTIESGHSWEIQLRGCSIWSVELMRRRIKSLHPEANVNAILIDFFLYDLAKERERTGVDSVPHHRTRSIWY